MYAYLPRPLAMADCPDDVASNATEGSNWCVVEDESRVIAVEDSTKSESEFVTDEEWQKESEILGSDNWEEADFEEKKEDPHDGCTYTLSELKDKYSGYLSEDELLCYFEQVCISEAASTAEEVPAEEFHDTVEEPSVELSPSALCLWAHPFKCGHPWLQQSFEHGGDITESWSSAIEGFPSVTHVLNLGRVTISSAAACADASTVLPLTVRATVQNSGASPWADATSLRILAGDSFGLHELPCGGLPAGCGAELVLDLAVPAKRPAHLVTQGTRSAWVLADANEEPFGPIFVVEVMWA